MKQSTPLDDFRWICTACNTVNEVTYAVCSSCKKSKPGDSLAMRADGTIVDQREAKSERDRFETWIQYYHADSWPNADSSGGRTLADGSYWNEGLQQRWEAWQAAQDPREVAERAYRIDFAAIALGVVERQRDELKIERDKALKTLREQPKFIAVRGCKPGDVVFLIPGQAMTAQQVHQIADALKLFSEETGIKIGLLPAGFTVSARDAELDDVEPPAPRPPRAFDPSSQDSGESR